MVCNPRGHERPIWSYCNIRIPPASSVKRIGRIIYLELAVETPGAPVPISFVAVIAILYVFNSAVPAPPIWCTIADVEIARISAGKQTAVVAQCQAILPRLVVPIAILRTVCHTIPATPGLLATAQFQNASQAAGQIPPVVAKRLTRYTP
jgi:hypothetical protein